MTTLTNDVKRYLEPAIRSKCINRVEVGVFAFTGDIDEKSSLKDVFSYDDTIAIAALMNKHYAARDAAAYVRQGLVAATPYRSGGAVEEWTEHKHQMHVGFFQLTDGGIWSVTADMDTRTIKPDEIDGAFVVVAKRGASIVSEDPADRARHLLTQCDERGNVLTAM